MIYGLVTDILAKANNMSDQKSSAETPKLTVAIAIILSFSIVKENLC